MEALKHIRLSGGLQVTGVLTNSTDLNGDPM